MDDAARSSVKQTRDHLTIVYCHNYYQHRGGEDISFERDVKLLRERGHEVIPFIRDNRQLESQSRISLATNTLWNRSIERQFRSLLTEHQPDLVHANNLFPQISVSILATAKRQGIPVVQALRNYRSFCANAFLYRDGKVCTACMTSVLPWSAIRHRCYRGSVGASTVVAAMQVFHRLKKVQQRYVDAFIAPTEFARQVHVEGGFEADRVHVRSNFLDPDPGQGLGQGDYAVFVGRLSVEKGVRTIVDAWNEHELTLPLRIIGSGPEEAELRQIAHGNPSIQFLGNQELSGVVHQLGNAKTLIMSSLWYETFGRTIAEAFACGTPVIASRLGAMNELVTDGVNGFHFTPGDAADLAKQVERMQSQSSDVGQNMRSNARTTFESRFTKSRSYAELIQIYGSVLGRSLESEQTPLCSEPFDLPFNPESTHGSRPAQLPTL